MRLILQPSFAMAKKLRGELRKQNPFTKLVASLNRHGSIKSDISERRLKEMTNSYRDALIQQIKDSGQELINRAESMVHPENDLITDFSIVIHFEQYKVPTIDYTTSVVNKVACDRVIYQKGESNVSKI